MSDESVDNDNGQGGLAAALAACGAFQTANDGSHDV